MGSGRDEDGALAERAALVALLRERPGRRGWAELTAAVLEAASARAVWERLVPPALVPPPGEPDPLDAAAREIGRWARPGLAAAVHPR